ncbi:MAG TPA: hypothetical protein VF707_02790 [Ardenticatenaceae bacterium]
MQGDKEPFVSGDQRPKVGFDADTPISELRVRDLQTLFGGPGGPQYKAMVSDTFHWKHRIKDYIKDYPDWHKQLKDVVDNYIPIPDFEIGPGPGPLMEQLVNQLSSLSEQVNKLSREVEAMRRQSGSD